VTQESLTVCFSGEGD